MAWQSISLSQDSTRAHGLDDIAEPPERRTVEQEIRDLTSSLDKYVSGDAHLSSEVVTDLGKAIHDIGDHLVDFHRRIEKLEEDKPEWTTRGWGPPPGE